MIKENVGKKIKALRIEKNMSQETLADLAGLDRTYITFVETAKKNVTIETLYKITNALGISLSEFFSDMNVTDVKKINSKKLDLSLDNLENNKFYTNQELSSIFLCSPQGGMRVSTKLKTVTLISKEIGVSNPYNDSNIKNDGTFIYTGMGLKGDQIVSLSNQNGKVAYSSYNGYRLFYFIMEASNKYKYIGEVKLNGDVFFEEEKDVLGNIRKVAKFPLKLI